MPHSHSNPYSLEQMLDSLHALRHYILLGDMDTPAALYLLEQLRTYLLSEESIKQCMMEQYYLALASYEDQLDQIRKGTEN